MRGLAPRDVGQHAVKLRAPPRSAVGEQVDGPPDGDIQPLGADGCELDTGGDAGANRHLVRVDDRVGKSAHSGDNRDRAVAQRAELSEATGLKTRWDEQRISAGLNQMRKALVLADRTADAAGMGRLGGRERILELTISGTEQRELGMVLEQRGQASN